MAEILDGEVAQINPIHRDTPSIRIVQAAEKLKQGTFARAIRSNNRHNVTGGNSETEIAQGDALATRIMEGDMLKADALLYGHWS